MLEKKKLNESVMDIINMLDKLSLHEISELITELQEKYGISGAMIAPSSAPIKENIEAAKSKEDPNFKIEKIHEGQAKTKLIMLIRKALQNKMLTLNKDNQDAPEVLDLPTLMSFMDVGTIFKFADNKNPEEINTLKAEIKTYVDVTLVS